MPSFRRGSVSPRSFEDASGVVWEVFEVQRASEAPRGVTPGLEKGWLAFVSAEGKRRLAPFPTEWRASSEGELRQLCSVARVAQPAPHSWLGASSRPGSLAAKMTSVPAPDEAGPTLSAAEGSLVRDVVRAFARDARATQLPAIEAMVRLKMLLQQRYGGDEVDAPTREDATDMRRVRRWFVEAFYFERSS